MCPLLLDIGRSPSLWPFPSSLLFVFVLLRDTERRPFGTQCTVVRTRHARQAQQAQHAQLEQQARHTWHLIRHLLHPAPAIKGLNLALFQFIRLSIYALGAQLPILCFTSHDLRLTSVLTPSARTSYVTSHVRTSAPSTFVLLVSRENQAGESPE